MTTRDEAHKALAERARWLQALIAHSSDLIAVLDEEARLLYANPAAARLLGHKPDVQPGPYVLDMVHPGDKDSVASHFADATRRSGPAAPLVFRLVPPSGRYMVIEALTTNCLNNPAIKGIVVNARDVTDRENLLRMLDTLSQANQILVRATDEMGLLKETCDNIVTKGQYLLAWVGYAENDKAQTVRPVAWAGQAEYLKDLHVSWGNNEFGRGPTGTAIRRRVAQTVNDTHAAKKFTPWRSSADEFGLRSSCALPIVVGDVAIGALNVYDNYRDSFDSTEVALLRELTDDLAYGIGRLRDSQKLSRNEALLREAESLATVGHWDWDLATGHIEFMADEIFRLHGITPKEWKGTYEAFLGLVHPSDRRRVELAIEKTLASGEAEAEHRICRPDGTEITVWKHTRLIRGKDGEPMHIIGTCQDISEDKELARDAELSRQFLAAIVDNMAEGLIAEDAEHKITLVNAAAERLLGWRATEMVGKFGHELYHYQRPDGSAYPVEECPVSAVWTTGEAVRADHDMFTRRDGKLLPVAYSASPLQTDEVHGAVLVFQDITEQAAEHFRVERELDKLSWVGRIRDALDQDRFVLYAQPIVDLKTGAVHQNELLIRMVSLSGEIVPPDSFLPTAEEFGLISEIDRWVVGETARLAAQGFRVEFNLSAKSVVDPNMLALVRSAFDAHGAPPANVVCEITETALLRDTAAAEAFVKGLNSLGCKVALDDFGAGYGGFSYLKRLPVSYLKIDREFVLDLPQEASSRHVVAAVVSLAKAFSLQTVAEGAEDQATLDALKKLGVDYVQGYVIARPGPTAKVLGPTKGT
ncbi:MAG: EAL domain-containing protein [Acidimicrobiales bacterium]|jgi:PAS domain S-box-containing protein